MERIVVVAKLTVVAASVALKGLGSLRLKQQFEVVTVSRSLLKLGCSLLLKTCRQGSCHVFLGTFENVKSQPHFYVGSFFAHQTSRPCCLQLGLLFSLCAF